MDAPLDKVAAQLNRDLALIAAGLVVAGGAIATGVYVIVDTLLRRHKAPGLSEHGHR
jgi:hypothetical protein